MVFRERNESGFEFKYKTVFDRFHRRVFLRIRPQTSVRRTSVVQPLETIGARGNNHTFRADVRVRRLGRSPWTPSQ